MFEISLESYRPSEMICQPNNGNMLQMLEKLSAQTIYYRPQANIYFKHQFSDNPQVAQHQKWKEHTLIISS